jgi:hypothetical protein
LPSDEALSLLHEILDFAEQLASARSVAGVATLVCHPAQVLEAAVNALSFPENKRTHISQFLYGFARLSCYCSAARCRIDLRHNPPPCQP